MAGRGHDRGHRHHPRAARLLGELLDRHLPGIAVWAFVSRTTGRAERYADLDLVVFSSPGQRSRVTELREACDESNLPFRVDLLVWDELPPAFHQVIEAHHVVFREATGS